MSYQSETVAAVITRLNVRYFLPAIQREFVWQPEQVLQLFDSLLSEYPTGSLLFWEIDQEKRNEYQVYKFLDEFKQGGTHNKQASTDGVQQLTLVIDGQQRLTSLLIGLKGQFIIKQKNKRTLDPTSWSYQQLYLDLLREPEDDANQDESQLRYGFRFLERAPKQNEDEYWFKVGKILDFSTEQAFKEYEVPFRRTLSAYPDHQKNKALRTLKKLYKVIWRDSTISHYTERKQDYDRVLMIFIRANIAGKKLSKSDLLMSVITSRWKGMSARDDIYQFVDHVNRNGKNNFDKDFIMKTCLVVCDLPVTYKVANFNNQNIDTIYNRWPDLKKAIDRAVTLVNGYGIDGKSLTGLNALIPIVYYLFHNPNKSINTASAFDVRNAAIIQRWLIGVLLNRVFGSLGDNVLKSASKVLKGYHDTDRDFPAAEINQELKRAGKNPSFAEDDVDRFLDYHTYESKECFLVLSLLYDEKAWGTVAFHVDHIFPKSLFEPKILNAHGIVDYRHNQYRDLCNRLGNLQLLPASENQGKSDGLPGEWLKSRSEGFRHKHLIPEEDALIDLKHFTEFIEAREKLIKYRLLHL